MKTAFYSLTLIILFSVKLAAQEIVLKDDKVLIDKIAKFDYSRKNMGSEFSLYKLNSKDEIVYMTQNTNGTRENFADDYIKFAFIESNTIVEVGQFHGRSCKNIIKFLLEEGILDTEGNIEPKKLETFALKYDDKIRDKKY